MNSFLTDFKLQLYLYTACLPSHRDGSISSAWCPCRITSNAQCAGFSIGLLSLRFSAILLLLTVSTLRLEAMSLWSEYQMQWMSSQHVLAEAPLSPLPHGAQSFEGPRPRKECLSASKSFSQEAQGPTVVVIQKMLNKGERTWQAVKRRICISPSANGGKADSARVLITFPYCK
jgi:hypothetical protein